MDDVGGILPGLADAAQVPERSLEDQALARRVVENLRERVDFASHKNIAAETDSRHTPSAPQAVNGLGRKRASDIVDPPYPMLDGVVVVTDSEFRRITEANDRRLRFDVVPLKAPAGLSPGAAVYIEGETQKTATVEGASLRPVAHVWEVGARAGGNDEPRKSQIVISVGLYGLTEEGWKAYPRGRIIP